ncbi:MAG: prolipoprotein diacylglyceryl transferase [Chloroflexi bacterium]|nr:prolipoprotein diacylglyceryl transferase [Chloroflexota bacterium]MCL5273265.1 prolipoprotein diacylglyceryl transferase [Chloroflexota bacterium]
MAAIALGVWLGAREAARKGFDKDDIYNGALTVIIAGLVGARIFHVIDHWPDEYAADPIRALYIWEGGLAIWGGVIGGLIAATVLAWRRKWRLPILLDALAPGLVLGQAVGRIACLITGDAMGKPTTGPLGFAYVSPNALVPQLGVYYTPYPLFEIVMNLVIFAILWRLRKRDLPDGALALIYLVLYSAGRFIISIWSSYLVVAFGLNQAQIVSVLGFAVALPLLIVLFLRQRNTPRVALQP